MILQKKKYWEELLVKFGLLNIKKEVTKLDLITTQNYGITRYKVKMHIYKSKNAQLNENEKWVSLDELASLPVPSPYRRALELITKG